MRPWKFALIASMGCVVADPVPESDPWTSTGTPTTSDSPPTDTETVPVTGDIRIVGELEITADRSLPTGTLRVVVFGTRTWLAGQPAAVWRTVEVGVPVNGRVPFEVALPGPPPDEMLDDYPYNTKYGGKYGAGDAHLGLGAYVDTNANGQPDADDVFVGVHPQALVYSYGSGGYSDTAHPPGWSLEPAVSDGVAPPVALAGDWTGVTLPANLLAIARPPLDVHIVPDRTGLASQLLALVQDDSAETLQVLAAPEGANTTVSLTPVAVPPGHEQDAVQGDYLVPWIRFAPYVGVVWADDGDGLWNGETVLATSDSADGPRLVFARPVWFSQDWTVDGTGWIVLQRSGGVHQTQPWDAGWILPAP